MSSHDVRDMLDLPSESNRPAKRVKIVAPRPVLKGLAREVQNLSGDNPIAIIPEISVFKKKKIINRKPAAKWERRAFKNTARVDKNFTLRHWRRKADVPPSQGGSNEDVNPEPEEEDSIFAKYNVQVNVPRYEDDQYKEKLEHPDWTIDETDYLVDLVQEFDLRWTVIWDRYEYTPPVPAVEDDASRTSIIQIPKERSMEDLKVRYYSVAAKMMAVNTPLERMKEAEFQLHETMLQFNPGQEKNRKHYAETLLHRSSEEAREEESLLMELKRVLARSEILSEERRELFSRLETPPSTGNFGIYTTSQGLQQLLQQLMSVDKSKKRKSLMGSEGISPAAGPAASNAQGNLDRRDSTIRESISGPSGGAANNKKGPTQGPSERRQLTQEEERIYGVSHHERLTASGPAYRLEKLSKPLTSKSAIQQTKMINILNEIEIPQRLVMPTADVGEVFESLLTNIHLLLDARKVCEKITGELAILKAQKAEREAAAKAARGEVDEVRNDETSAPAAATTATEGGDVKKETRSREPSAAPRKRSASVLSAISDKSSKRQKK